jgi:hypothetical protein
MIKRFLFITTLTSLFVFAGMAIAAPATAKKPGILFIVSAKSGNIQKTGRRYTLTLNQTNPKTLWYQDRPGHKAGLLPTSTFIKHWDHAFMTSRPKLALVHANLEITTGAVMQEDAMVLMNPIEHGDTVVFHLHLLKGDFVAVGKFLNTHLVINTKNKSLTDVLKNS